jgi:hypothetical protein
VELVELGEGGLTRQDGSLLSMTEFLSYRPAAASTPSLAPTPWKRGMAVATGQGGCRSTGVNAVTLMELKEPPDPQQQALLPVVRYAVERRVARGRPDYWDHATLLELAVLARDENAAAAALADALACLREGWEAETTARNLRLIRGARAARGEDVGWIEELEQALAEARPG